MFALCLFFCACGGGSNSDASSENIEEALQFGQISDVVRNCGQVDQPLRIMPLGDSITEGVRGRNSYRRPLWQKLQKAGCIVDFVGSKTGVSAKGSRDSGEAPARDSDFDQDHEAYWDYRIDEILAFVDLRVADAQPDIVLVHLGTNDLIQGQSVEETLAELEVVIDALRSGKADVIILLAKIIPTAASSRTTAFNAGIDALVLSKQSDNSPILIIDQAHNYFLSDNFDKYHPAQSGEEKLAEKWFGGVMQASAAEFF